MPYFRTAQRTPTNFYQWLIEELDQLLRDAKLDADARRQTALLIGSSSFDVHVSEQQYRTEIANLGSEQAVAMPIVGYGKLAERCGDELGLSPHRHTYSTACTSSANAMIYGKQLIEQSLVKHVLVLGLEPENNTSALGFYGLGLISPSEQMHPFDNDRDGLVLGEGLGAVLLSDKSQTPEHEQRFRLMGGAIGTDNHSLTAAHVDGAEIARVIEQALAQANIKAQDIAAIKVHGTASLKNDEAEAAALHRVFGPALPTAFAFKPYIGHTLGACGALEVALTLGCLQVGKLPCTPNAKGDGDLGITITNKPLPSPTGYYLFNCFAFGGNNNALLVHDQGAEARH
ncbi:beta-ketoacyl synthase N-terminal-like domain-containing protein [Gilvimarinus sp. SDUM040013]|uniref:Beta-ketoacyl synthase N-terminal-like domain-containing protein n=1 Tax=Gilvimarinus gilvus TaxID=3058038 RepID=A0ABU4S1M9_9GAMM|nr:beta-ketoacyl synthase N-terminal-like domain-containing protein [Gilvimarinus sp. SDUM040013]MDO3387804.1 beta-ketoacyl synthase N-terminal-like domain-containing protein [Gilvimarinus sp. SDUM040013]MDX6851053.1 beta-ketoacyl synthase N-terminal-like domain-containing protein [Gilvimarinus sp. SDUM040013]